jgi:dihydrofolate reductase
MSNFVYVGASLDGYIATADHGLDWLTEVPNPVGDDLGFADFMADMDALVMGRKTFEVVLSFGDWTYSKPVFVLSKSTITIPQNLQGKVESVGGELEALVQELNRKGYGNLYIDGGATIQSFLRADLIDEMIITTLPVLLGDGIPLFADLRQSMKFTHCKTEVLLGQLVKSYYSRIRGTP